MFFFSQTTLECFLAFFNFPSSGLVNTHCSIVSVPNYFYFLGLRLYWLWSCYLLIPSCQFRFQVSGSILFVVSLMLITLASWIVSVLDHLRMACSCTSNCSTYDVEVQHEVQYSPTSVGSSAASVRERH